MDGHQLLKSYLVKSKIYPPERKVGSKKCKSKRCLVCLNVFEMDVFQSFQTNGHYKINHKLICNDKCVIYLLSCKICCCSTYVSSLINLDAGGIIKRKIIGQQKEGRNICSHLSLSIFFKWSYGLLEDCSINLIDKTDGSDPTRREEYWRIVLKTVTPYGFSTI